MPKNPGRRDRRKKGKAKRAKTRVNENLSLGGKYEKKSSSKTSTSPKMGVVGP